MHRNFHFLVAASIILAPTIAVARDVPLRIVIGTHLLEEIRSHDAMPQLMMDGKVIFNEANSYKVKLQGSLDGIPSAIVYADQSGASCDMGTSLFITANTRSASEVGHVDNDGCWTIPEYALRKAEDGHEAYVVQQDPGVSYSGDLWSFSIVNGLHKEADLLYAPEPGTTYADLRASISHGKKIDLFKNEGFFRDFEHLTGSAKETILRAVGWADPASLIDGRFLIAEGFQSHDAQHQTLIAVDLFADRVFVADYPGEGKIAVYPVVGSWPSPIRRKLAAWGKLVAKAAVETAATR